MISVNPPDWARLQQGQKVKSRYRGECIYLGITLDKKQYMFKDKNGQYVFINADPETYYKFLDLSHYR